MYWVDERVEGRTNSSYGLRHGETLTFEVHADVHQRRKTVLLEIRSCDGLYRFRNDVSGSHTKCIKMYIFANAHAEWNDLPTGFVT